MNDDTMPIPRVRDLDEALTGEHRAALDEIGKLASAARTHLTVWDAREMEGDPGAVEAMGRAIDALDRLLRTGKGLVGGLRLEDATAAVEDGREAYQIRKRTRQNGSV